MECRITVMCSGSGTNLQALIDAVAAGKIPGGRIVRVVTNRKDAFATKRAEQVGIPTLYFNMIKEGYHKAGEKNPDILREARSRYDAALAAKILEDKPDLIVLAGWMHVFTESFLEVLEPAGIKIINLHPALPGKYNGANAIARAHADFEAGKADRTGVMIHYVIQEVDQGTPILVEEVEHRPGQTLAELEERIHVVEHRLIVAATAKVVTEILAAR